MTVFGDALGAVTNLEAVIGNMATGKVNLSWDFDRSPTFMFFRIERDGQTIATTTNQVYSDMLPGYGTYSYVVYPVYEEGDGQPDGPAEVIWGIPELTWEPATLVGDVWTNNTVTVGLKMKNTGEGQLHFEFTGFDDPYFSNAYITSVSPYEGDVLAGDSMMVYVVMDANGYNNGSYNTNLLVNTNELPPNDSHNIPTTMNVTTPGSFVGVVTDCDNGSQLEAVTVTAVDQADPDNVYTAQTIYNGSYELFVSAGTYDITFHKLGYDDATAVATATEGNATTVDGQLCVTPYPVSWVFADPNEADDACLVTWSVPMGPYEIIYDDGTAEDYVIFVQAGGAAAVRFTPAGYPATVMGGRVYVGDGSFPENGANFLGTDVSVGILDDDGANGGPGTVLDSVTLTVNNYGWVDFNGAFNRTFDEGDFYIVVWQLNGPDMSAPIGIDTEIPTVYRSYARPAGFDWVVSSYQDMMIRAYVKGPNQGITMNADPNRLVRPVKPLVKCYLATGAPKAKPGYMKAGEYRGVASENSVRGFSAYKLARINGFDPNAGQGPEDGVKYKYFGATTQNSKNDTQFGGEPMGWYAYSVRALYETGFSKWTYSNIVGHLMDVTATFTVTQCDDLTPNNVEVTMTGHDYPYSTYFATSGDDGIIYFDSIIKGTYDIRIFKVGYQPQEFSDVLIMDDYTYTTVLEQNAYPVRNLYVDALTSVATWDEPLITQIYKEGFEAPTFPPEGWQSSTIADGSHPGWYRSCIADGMLDSWIIPDWEGHYAVTNDDYNGSGHNASMDYLITPQLDLRESDDFALYFDSYFDALYGGMASVEYSTDNGATWNTIVDLTPATDWTAQMVDLSALSGANGLASVWIGFHFNDGSTPGDIKWTDGWAVDNVELHNGAAPVEGYVVYLDNAQVAELPADVRTYQFGDLVYGTTYTASVRAKYACNLSEPRFYTWQSTYLYPPRNLTDGYVYNTNEVPLMWNPPMTGDGIPMMAAEPVIVYQGAPQNVTANSEVASVVTVLDYGTNDGSRDTWDLQFTWPTYYNDGEAGCESDGNFIYTAKWNGDRFSKYTLDGTWVEDFTIPGVTNVRDLAYDGTYFYGAAANTSVFQMDFETHTLVSTINAPTAVRAIAYNDDEMTFYGNNWSTDITEFDMTGAMVSSFAAGGLTGIYGMAYDNWSDGGPFLWIYDQGANNLNQVTLPDGTFTGFTVDVQAITGATSSAGGLFTQPGIVEGTVTIGGNSQNEMIWGLELAPYTGGSGTVPDGLISFNVYRDGVVIGNKEYNGEGTEEWIKYVDNPVMPGTYLYEVSALYDLGQFGFPGEIGESALEGIDTVTVVWGMDLPFSEDWKEGTFDFNSWTAGTDNWRINSQVGDDAPSAEFTWDPLLENDYRSCLTTAPMKADKLTEGDIWLDYNLKLMDRNSTGEEHMKVEVFDGETWHQVADITNTGSFDFADGFNHVNITNFAMGKVFQVRFAATGQNSFDVISWYVDNINVYRTCAAPKDIEGMYEWNFNETDTLDWGARINWIAPDIPMPIAEWIHWDNGENFSAIGLTDGGDFTVAARWDAGQLADYDGTFITKLQYFPATTDFSNIIVRIWTGANASNLIYENDVTATTVGGMWNEVVLDTPIALDVNDELWIGYTLLGQLAGTFPAGTDAGPAIAGYGDKITTDGVTWDNLSDFGLSYNWNVEAFVEELSTNAVAPTPIIDNTVYSTPNATLAQGSINQNGGHAYTEGSRDFTGFKLYRSVDGEDGPYVEYATIPYEDGVTEYTYFDKAPAVDAQTTYWYKVSAVWASDVDQCESAFAPRKNLPIYDFVEVFVTDVNNPLAGTVGVYPNPATTDVTVSTTDAMNKITVINYVGQVVYQESVNGSTSVHLNTANYEAGVYVIKIETANGTTNKRVVITK
jgi:hypothetical protein